MKLSKRQLRRHKAVIKIAKPIAAVFMKRMFNYEYSKVELPDGPFIVVANHNSDMDPIMVGIAFPHMYFVASEHIFRKPFIAWLLNFFLAPIGRRKGSVDAGTVLEMKDRLKAGQSLCIFPEGNKSLDGCTGEIHPTTGKLIKACGVTLVTYRLSGGFLSTPRWGFKRRKGKVRGQCIGIYPKERIKAMKPEEVTALIRADLHEDCYATQEKEMVRFRSKAPADGLETALYLCPSCKMTGKLTSTKHEIVCECGFRTVFNEYGYFENPDTGFKTYTEWYRWQYTEIEKLIQDTDGSFPVKNNQAELFEVPEGNKSRMLMSAEIHIMRDRFWLQGIDGQKTEFLFSDIASIGMCGRNELVFTCAGNYYELKTHKRFNSRLVLHLVEIYSSGLCESCIPG